MANYFYGRKGDKVLLKNSESGRLFVVGLLRNDVFEIRKKREHLYRRDQSYGFNREMMVNLAYHKLRVLVSTDEVLETTKAYLLEFGIVRQCDGYDEQIFLRVKEFGLKTALEFERELQFKRKCHTVDMWEIAGVPRPTWNNGLSALPPMAKPGGGSGQNEKHR